MRSRTKKDLAEKRPRGRPRAYEPEIALRQAMEAFWKTGYSGTSLDDISAATGMNRPSLRAAFGDKHDIYLKALGNYWTRKFAAMHDAFAGGGSLAEALMRAYEVALSTYFAGDDQARGCFVVGTAITEASSDAEIQAIVRKGFDGLDAAFEARIRQARDAGELDTNTDIQALAMLATATMHTLAVRARAGSPQNDLRTLAQKAVSVICG